ncbi:SGNH hydrolase-type esterase domain-containing protein [Aspergillus ambiguus]|uniref:SGNH/GDSL hydrolase family protein n=1 Tax=Aspergillus ambiguus TaxID=176160 RepID=UPI003CCCEFF0
MPLGASITAGYHSTDGNGYRKWLRDELEDEGWEVDMVGSQQNGTMQDNDHEGHIGFRIDQIAAVAEKSLHLQPNVILLNVGTNDALQDYQVDTAGDRINALMVRLLEALPDATVILSTLLPNTVTPAHVNTINEQYRKIAVQRDADGERIVLADMDRWIRSSEMADDGIHPTDHGYQDMAWVWSVAIKDAREKRMIQSPSVSQYRAVTPVSTSDGLRRFQEGNCLLPLVVALQLGIGF